MIPGTSFIQSSRRDIASVFFTGLTGVCTFLITLMLAIIIGNIVYHGWGSFSWRFVTSGTEHGMFNVEKAGVFPMVFGTAARVIVMTIFVVPVGVITAIYMTEYAHRTSMLVRILRGAINNLAGVPSIVFGLFGLGFFISFIGQGLDTAIYGTSAEPVWGKPAIIWASLTLAVMTLPVVIVATEESLKAIPMGLREASLALGATKLETIRKIVFPQALPGILTGGILAVSRAAGEVAQYYLPARPITWLHCPRVRQINSWTLVITFTFCPPNLRTWSRPDRCSTPRFLLSSS